MISRLLKNKKIKKYSEANTESINLPYKLTESNRDFFLGAEETDLAFKYGFVAHVPKQSCIDLKRFPVIQNWPEKTVSDLEFVHHPSTSYEFQTKGRKALIIIGEVFNPYSKQFDAKEIVTELISRLHKETSFFDYLDELSGRFVVLVKDGDWKAYSDAFAARSIFYDAGRPGFISSHAALTAEITGDHFDFNMLAFIQSNGYQKRDVKYLPGLRTMWKYVYYCPANHSINLHSGVVQRFWPRQGIKDGSAEQSLITYLDGYSDYIKKRYDREIFGLTAGLDSRTILAALVAKNVPITTFTLNRGEDGNSKDIQIAAQISKYIEADHKQIKIDGSKVKEAFFTEVMQVLRQSSGHMRLNSPYGNHVLYEFFKEEFPGEKVSYSRGFGGEILRGFYQNKSGRINSVSSPSFANAYGVLAGSPIVRDAFEHYISCSNYDDLYGIDVNDIFYWEHRMSGWAAVAVAETDLTACTFVGYNSRRLYSAFLTNGFDDRIQRNEFKSAISHFKPELLDFEIA